MSSTSTQSPSAESESNQPKSVQPSQASERMALLSGSWSLVVRAFGFILNAVLMGWWIASLLPFLCVVAEPFFNYLSISVLDGQTFTFGQYMAYLQSSIYHLLWFVFSATTMGVMLVMRDFPYEQMVWRKLMAKKVAHLNDGAASQSKSTDTASSSKSL
jgi:hypothetical protein